MKRLVRLALGLMLSVAFPSCARHESAAERSNAITAGAAVDPTLLAFLSRARAAHHLADDHENEGDLGAAIAPLASLIAGPFPYTQTVELAPEVREVLADTHARLADLLSRQGAFDRALDEIHVGLEHAREPNYFRGHLLETEGLVEERHARAEESSDPKAAATLRKRAIGLLEQAMAVQSGVLESAQTGQ